jgi:acyl-CoA synthetase (AMP-forming)/AMP-acid ligase II
MRLFDETVALEYIARGSWSGLTWGDCLDQAVAQYGERECLVDPINKPDVMGQEAVRLTWSRLEGAVDRCAEFFFEHGIRANDVVGIQIPNSVELIITYLALNRLGAIISPYATAYRRHELVQLTSIAGARAIVTTAGFSGTDLLAGLSGLVDPEPAPNSLFAWHAGSKSGAVDLDLREILQGPNGEANYLAYRAALRPHPNDCAMILFTSGTTGIPKGVPRGHGDSLASAAATVASPRLTFQDTVLAPMPMVNAGAMSGMFLPWLLTGCRLVLHHPFNLEVFASQIERESVTYSVAPPTILNDMVADDAIFGRYDLSSLRALGAGSAPLSGWMIKRWESDHGVEIINYFGATEGLQLTADRDTVPDPAMRARYLPKPGSPAFAWRTAIGRETSCRLVDVLTSLEITEPGIPGELRVKGPNIFAGYLHVPEVAFDEQGYYRTGDIFEYAAGHVDKLELVDRAKDVIIRGGMNISAAEVESMLIGHPQVAEVAAVGKKDERLGERTCIFVVPRTASEPPSLEDLVEFLHDQGIARYKVPEFLEIVESLPRNSSGKALKFQLRQRLDGSQSRITHV